MASTTAAAAAAAGPRRGEQRQQRRGGSGSGGSGGADGGSWASLSSLREEEQRVCRAVSKDACQCTGRGYLGMERQPQADSPARRQLDVTRRAAGGRQSFRFRTGLGLGGLREV